MNRKSEELKEKQISEIMLSIENRVRHAYNQGFEQGLKASKQETCDDCVSRKVGCWQKVVDRIDERGNKRWHHECSECGSQNSGWGEYSYCPDCGCRMNEDHESEENE